MKYSDKGEKTMIKQMRSFKCDNCEYKWEVAYGSGKTGRELFCPKCGSSNMHRIGSRMSRRGARFGKMGRRLEKKQIALQFPK